MQTHPHIDADKWRALALRLRVWLCEVLLWLADAFGDHPIGREVRADLRADLRDTQRCLRNIITLIALSRLKWSETPGRRTLCPGSFKRRRCQADLRHVGRIVQFRARTLRGRVLRLRAVIDNLDGHVARMVKRLEAGFRQLAPIIVVALTMRTSVGDTTASIADSS